MGSDMQFLQAVVGVGGGDVERIGGREAAFLHAPAQAPDVLQTAAHRFLQLGSLRWCQVVAGHAVSIRGDAGSKNAGPIMFRQIRSESNQPRWSMIRKQIGRLKARGDSGTILRRWQFTRSERVDAFADQQLCGAAGPA